MSDFGMALGGEVVNAQWTSTATITTMCNNAASLGAKWLRVEAPETTDFTRLDMIVGKVVAAGMAPLLVITKRAESGGMAVPTSSFAVYAGTVAARYANVPAIEVMNEVNDARYWGGDVDPQAYGTILASCYDAIKAARPATLVVSAGLMINSGTEYTEPMHFFAAMLPYCTNKFNVCGHHIYFADTSGDWSLQVPSANDKAVTDIAALRSQLNAAGMNDVPIWITETGVSSCGAPLGTSAASQAPYTQSIWNIVSNTEAQRIFFYTVWNQANSTHVEYNYGAYTFDWSEKPVAAVYRTIASQGTAAAVRQLEWNATVSWYRAVTNAS